MARTLHVVTGGLGYTGKAIVEQLLSQPHAPAVRTLTNSRDRPNPFGDRLDIQPLAFDSEDALARSLEGCSVLYNTYWVRFNHARFNFEHAVTNSRRLFAAAKRAGVGRVVHVSILHARSADDLEYYRGKHVLEQALQDSGLPHAIVRPGVLFGRFDVLVNNIAWVLRHLPVFGVFGDGSYALRPLHVDDMASLMIAAGTMELPSGAGPVVIDAAGPERFTYRELVACIAKTIGIRRLTISVPPFAGLLVSKAVNPFVRDVIITRQEIAGLMRGLLDSTQPASTIDELIGREATRLSVWAHAHREVLGVRYASEVGRRVQRNVAYDHVK